MALHFNHVFIFKGMKSLSLIGICLLCAVNGVIAEIHKYALVAEMCHRPSTSIRGGWYRISWRARMISASAVPLIIYVCGVMSDRIVGIISRQNA